jgi:predicted tellurium resistance membrane protein TerC
MHLTTPLFTVLGHEMTGRHLILLGGGLFLIAKASHEIYEKVEVDEEEAMAARGKASLAGTVFQIMLLDIVFSLDSVITAVGMVEEIEIMVIAVIVAVVVMLIGARPIGMFVNRHPSMKILALSFLLLIGVLLTAEGFGQHISKGYVYFAMGFSVTIEILNMRFRKKHPKHKEPSPAT